MNRYFFLHHWQEGLSAMFCYRRLQHHNLLVFRAVAIPDYLDSLRDLHSQAVLMLPTTEYVMRLVTTGLKQVT